MKFILTLTFLLFTLSFVFVGTEAFQCYQCGDDDGVVVKGFDHPCPDNWLKDDLKYIVDCPVGTNKKYKCKRKQSPGNFFGKIVVENKRQCQEVDENDYIIGYQSCSKYVCECFTSLCNGLEIDAIIEKGEIPFNPYLTTTTTTTTTTTSPLQDDSQRHNSTSGKTSQKEDASKATVILLPVILLAYKL